MATKEKYSYQEGEVIVNELLNEHYIVVVGSFDQCGNALVVDRFNNKMFVLDHEVCDLTFAGEKTISELIKMAKDIRTTAEQVKPEGCNYELGLSGLEAEEVKHAR